MKVGSTILLRRPPVRLGGSIHSIYPNRFLSLSAALMKRIGVAIILAFTAARVAQAQFKSAALPELDQDATRALVPVVKNIRAEPSSMTIKVGQIVQLRTINVIVVDSSGKDRGRLSGFDFSNLKGQPAEVVPRHITGMRPGTATLTIHYPRTAWKGRSDPQPAATVTIDVKP
jgi:hypothetical protein